MTHAHPNRRFVPQVVLIRSGKINTAGASVNTVGTRLNIAIKPVNTAGSKPTVNHSRSILNAYKKGYSQVTRPFNKFSANKNSIFNKKVNTVRVKDTTARDRVVYKGKGVIDSGCSRHMTGNKCYLSEYEDYDGGFVSFGDGKGRISGKDDLHGDEVIVDMAVGEKQKQSAKVDEREVNTGVEYSVVPTILVTTAGEGVTATKIDEITTSSAPTTTIDEITLAQTLIEIKAAKPKAVTTVATTTTTTRPKAIGVVVQEPSEFRTTTTSSPQASQPSKTKDKGKAIMIEPEVPLKKKDQVALDEEIERNLKAQLQGELIEEERLARKKEEEANITLIESWKNTQAMMEADRLLAERLQTKEQEELTDREKAKLFMEFMEKRRKHFAALRAQEKRNRPPTKTQKRNQMST
ncbi:hypothetical protein Tco_0273541 [Tanacetum coccineum]